MAYNFNTTYALDPWDPTKITQNQRTWYDPTLRERYVRQSVYSQNVTMKIDTNAMQSRTIIFNDLIPPRPYIGVAADRAMNSSRLWSDSFQRQLTVQHYTNGMSLHRESELFNYWKSNGAAGLRGIIQQSMGGVVVDHYDLLARNAFFTNPYAMFGIGSASSFAGISTSTDRLTTDVLDAIWLGMRDRSVPWAALPVTFEPSEIFCITTPGAIYDLKREIPATNTFASNKFVNIMEYADPSRLVAGEVGTYRGVRFVESPMAELWNVGTITTQTKITAAVKPGDGAPDPATTAVDTVRHMGQPGATHSITVTSTTGFVVGQKVTIHRTRFNTGSGLGLTNPLLGVTTGGVSNGGGVDFTDPMAQDLEIYSIPDSTHLVFTAPYMMTDLDTAAGLGLETDLGSTTYGYVTLGANIHTALFLNNTYKNGVVAGVAQPARFYTPPAVDDLESIFRISYDFWTKYQLWEPQTYEVAFLAGSNKNKGIPYAR